MGAQKDQSSSPKGRPKQDHMCVTCDTGHSSRICGVATFCPICDSLDGYARELSRSCRRSCAASSTCLMAPLRGAEWQAIGPVRWDAGSRRRRRRSALGALVRRRRSARGATPHSRPRACTRFQTAMHVGDRRKDTIDAAGIWPAFTGLWSATATPATNTSTRSNTPGAAFIRSAGDARSTTPTLRVSPGLIPYGGRVVKGSAGRGALNGRAPRAQGCCASLRDRPAPALDPGASAGPGQGLSGRPGACPMGARSPSPLLWVTVSGYPRRIGAGKVASFVGPSGV